ncbi:hypothetical protein SAMN06295885_0230 [Rathayibacter oskolensis]|uniref:DUF5709 domain-containing protein n=1 Tax=Rathayibacter oskolensis TaxID=1891671 RepID=A0A1X7MWH1_9MICO|nr:hypothetical protein [Rathayibacter oskolensis]SMH28734.1 hypothetical protein SAMN06295885_0230 [Rathayibacter oskolensis]
MAHDDETGRNDQAGAYDQAGDNDQAAETDQAARRGRHLADEANTTETPDGEYTSTDGVSHTAGDEQGSYVDTSEHEEDTSVEGSYVDTEAAHADSDVEGEYTDRDE